MSASVIPVKREKSGNHSATLSLRYLPSFVFSFVLSFNSEGSASPAQRALNNTVFNRQIKDRKK